MNIKIEIKGKEVAFYKLKEESMQEIHEFLVKLQDKE